MQQSFPAYAGPAGIQSTPYADAAPDDAGTAAILNRLDAPRPDANGWCGIKLTSTERFIYNSPGYSAAESLHVQQ